METACSTNAIPWTADNLVPCMWQNGLKPFYFRKSVAHALYSLKFGEFCVFFSKHIWLFVCGETDIGDHALDIFIKKIWVLRTNM
jgi:hypothetical protein